MFDNHCLKMKINLGSMDSFAETYTYTPFFVKGLFKTTCDVLKTKLINLYKLYCIYLYTIKNKLFLSYPKNSYR